MSVQGEINRIKDAVSDAYSAVSDKGGDMPTLQNVANLAQAVNSIPTGPDDTKMDKANPTGSGSFSLNRKADTTVGNYSHAEGYNTTASGNYSHAEGYNTTASGYSSHTEGYNTTASTAYSHAEGTYTRAIGSCSHAEGDTTTASGNYSHAEGCYTVARGFFSHAQGKYNVEDTEGVFADIVGWGESNSNRKNISSLTTEGDLHLAGDVYVGANADGTGGTKLGAGGESDVFVIEDGVTPFVDIRAAYLANKLCVLFDVDNNRLYYLIKCTGTQAVFYYFDNYGAYRSLTISSANVWNYFSTPVVLRSNISTEISSSSTNSEVAGAKAVYDYIQSLDAREVSY